MDAYLEEELYDILTYCIQNPNASDFESKKRRMKDIGRDLFYKNKPQSTKLTNFDGKDTTDKNDLDIAIKHQEVNYNSSRKSYLFECYYCDKFLATTNQTDYEKHVVLNHNNKSAYPSKADLLNNNIKPQGKS